MTVGEVTTLRVLVAGCGVPSQIDSEVIASGPGWSWAEGSDGPVHFTGPTGPRGPLTVRLATSPHHQLHTRLRAAIPSERWTAAPPPPPASAVARRRAVDALAAHQRADLLVDPAAPVAALISRFAGRGPGLTPEGDDLLMGLVAARRAVAAPGAPADAEATACWARASAGEPSRSLLIHASRGELGEPAHRVLDALVAGDATAAEAALPPLLAWGASSGRALFTGLCAGVCE